MPRNIWTIWSLKNKRWFMCCPWHEVWCLHHLQASLKFVCNFSFGITRIGGARKSYCLFLEVNTLNMHIQVGLYLSLPRARFPHGWSKILNLSRYHHYNWLHHKSSAMKFTYLSDIMALMCNLTSWFPWHLFNL